MITSACVGAWAGQGWQLQGTAMSRVQRSPTALLPPRPAILPRESSMGTVFFHFKVSRGAVWTHRPFVQPPSLSVSLPQSFC